MKYSEHELAEKMKKRLATERERQRRWRQRQKEKGLKPVAGMISEEAFNILITQKEQTGSTTSEILERALRSMNAPVERLHDRREPVIPPGGMPDDHPETPPISREDIIDRIKKMRREDNLPFNEIARIFNGEGLRTADGNADWDGKRIYTIFKTLEDN